MRRLAVFLCTLVLVPLPAQAASSRQSAYKQWDTQAQLSRGMLSGTAVVDGKLVIADPAAVRGRWTSRLVKPGFALTELVPSWVATTPGDSWVKVQVGSVATGWDTISRWASGDAYVKRTSLGSQPDRGASVSYDTWKVPAGTKSWRIRITLYRSPGTAGPSVDTIGAVASRGSGVPTTSTPLGVNTVLPVPAYSQMVHAGTYPEYDGGGEAWCSPTSTSMVLAYYNRLPQPADYAWTKPGPDRFVVHAARMTFDYAFEGTGNWPFNTAYAAGLTGRAFVTRLASLQDAERFIAAGIPVVASISFGRGQLKGAPISATNGHLVVISGFTATGDPVVNDPAATTKIQRTYSRAQFEAAWMRKSGGLAYVITDPAHPLPAREGARRW